LLSLALSFSNACGKEAVPYGSGAAAQRIAQALLRKVIADRATGGAGTA
jgi:hypothetical protein